MGETFVVDGTPVHVAECREGLQVTVRGMTTVYRRTSDGTYVRGFGGNWGPLYDRGLALYLAAR